MRVLINVSKFCPKHFFLSLGIPELWRDIVKQSDFQVSISPFHGEVKHKKKKKEVMQYPVHIAKVS